MGTPATLPLSDIVDVIVQIAPQAPALPTFNIGLVLGQSTHIPSWGANSRIRKYSTLAQMSTDGFLNNDPEYIAAQIYFSQSPAPQFIYIGRIDHTGGSIEGAVVNAGGTGYKVGDIVTVAVGTFGKLKVATVAAGVVTGLSIVQDGMGYTTSTAVATTGGTGTGLTVDITAGNETVLQALQYCRNITTDWYALYVCAITDADIINVAGYTEAADPAMVFFFNTADVDVLNNNANNICAQMLALDYSRTCGIYSTTQGGLFPNNAYSGAGAMGTFCGLNTGLANSYFTMKFKQIVGVAPEPLTETNIGNLNAIFCNYYVTYQKVYTIFAQGYVQNGQFLDEIVQLDMLVVDIQFSVMNILVGTPAVPQTDPGEVLLMNAVNGAADRSVARGFIAPGIWTGVQILQLQDGDPVPAGYITQAQPYRLQSKSDREARKAMPIYLAIIEAGAVHSIVIGVYVQR